jgi:hypothetical protein
MLYPRKIMTPEEEKEYLESLAKEAGDHLQEIQNNYGPKNTPSARVKFPRGFIRTAEELRKTLPNLGEEVQRRNASYALMKNDIDRWLAIRTDLYGAALSMVIKDAIVTLGGICEWLTKEATRGNGRRRSYRVRTEKLVEMGVIDQNLKEELDWVWEIRCNSHMHGVEALEHVMYSRQDYNRARRAYGKLIEALVIVHGVAP